MTIDRRALIGATALALAGGAATNVAAIVAAKASENPANCGINSDPIFALIEQHRASDIHFREVVAVDDDETESWSEADKRERADLQALLQCKPTTLAGCIAVLRYVAEHAGVACSGGLFSDCLPDVAEAGEAFPSMIADALDSLAVAS